MPTAGTNSVKCVINEIRTLGRVLFSLFYKQINRRTKNGALKLSKFIGMLEEYSYLLGTVLEFSKTS